MMDPQVEALGLTNWIPGQAYPSPVFVVRAPDATFDTVYKVHALPMTTTKQVYYSAPDYSYKSNQLYPIAHAKQNNLGLMHGAAPTVGIYTGIPSGCTPSGTPGGNPYS